MMVKVQNSPNLIDGWYFYDSISPDETKNTLINSSINTFALPLNKDWYFPIWNRKYVLSLSIYAKYGKTS